MTAKLTKNGCVIASCPNCEAKTTYEWRDQHNIYGIIQYKYLSPTTIEFVLYKCNGCGWGGIGCVEHKQQDYKSAIANSKPILIGFYPNTVEPNKLPKEVPEGIRKEYREAEKCLKYECYRAAAGLFRSVLDKTLKHNGYANKNSSLYHQIESAANDGILTDSRRKRAHDEIRVLGNDVLHDDWCPIELADVELARHYSQRILEDFYDDRPTVESQLIEKGRIKKEPEEPEQ